MIVCKTNRLTLRRFTHQDIDNLLTIFSDPEAMRFFPGVKDRNESEEWLLGLKRLISLIDPQNVRSVKVAKNIGMQFEKGISRWNKRFRVYQIEESDQ